MITSLRLIDFKNFADEILPVGPFTVIVGENASGKSNIRDAFRFLHGIGRRYTLMEILTGKYNPGGQLEWAGIRGAINEVVRLGQYEFALEVTIEPLPFSLVGRSEEIVELAYSIRVRRDRGDSTAFRVIEESLTANSETVFTSSMSPNGSGNEFGSGPNLRVSMPMDEESLENLRPDRPILYHLAFPQETVSEEGMADLGIPRLNAALCSLRVMNEFLKTWFLEPSPEHMREPSFPGITVLGASGEYLPSVLNMIHDDVDRRDTLTSWLQELTPMEVSELVFRPDPTGKIHLYLREVNGREVSAYSASDGTLRFLSILAALLGEGPADTYFLEEIDSGLHPNRLWLLVQLIQQHTTRSGIQVITTTHSPDMLNFINDDAFEHTSVVYRDEESSDAIIRSVASLPKSNELRKSQGLGRLHSTGWMEDVLSLAIAHDKEMDGS